MSTFDEAKHPRGQVKNKGQFTKSAQFGANGQARDWAVRLMNRMGGHSEVPTMEVNARTGKADRPILQGDLFPPIKVKYEQSRREQDAADRKYEARANLSRLDSIKKDAATLPHPSFAPVQDAVKKALASDPREEVREGHVVIIANEGTVFDSTKDFHFRVRIYSKDGATIGEMSRTSHSATKEIHNNVFQMKDAFQGGGLAFHLQEHLFDAYRKAGYELVTVDAAGTRRDQIKATGGDYCGNIAWAAMGFTWKDKAMRDEMRDQFHGWLRDNRRVYQKFEESAYANGRSIEEHLDAIVKHPWTLTRFKVDGVEGEQAQAGKLFLAQSGQWWKGKFSLKPRSVSSRQFEAALEAKKKAASSKAEAS